MARLPAGCEEAPRRRAEGLSQDMLSALYRASRLFGIQAVHLVAAIGQQRDRPTASLALMEVAVKEKLLGAFLDQPAVLGMRHQWPLAVPVGNHAEGKATPEQGCEVPEHHSSLARVGRSGVMDADEEAPPVIDAARLDSSVSPITSGKRLNGGREIGAGEVRPQDVGEVELGVGRLPEQEVTQSLLSAGADEQIHVTRTARCVDGLIHGSLERLAGRGYPLGETARRRQQRIAGRIVHRNPEVESGPFARPLLDVLDAASEGIRDPVPTPDDAEAHTTVRQVVALGVQVLLEQTHQVVHFALRTTPVVRGERVERQRGDPERRRGLHRSPDRRRSGDMARLPGLTAQQSPAAVPIHVDRDVESVPVPSFRRFGVPPSRIQAGWCHKASSVLNRPRFTSTTLSSRSRSISLR